MQRKWKILSETLSETGKYYAPRLKPRLLAGRYYARRAAIRETTEVIGDRSVQAYAALWRSSHLAWYELGTVWIGEDLRGNGLLDELMAEVVGLAPRGANLFLITPVEAIMDSAQKLGFHQVTTQTHSRLLSWASEAGIVTRLPGSVYPIAPNIWSTPTAGERWLYLKMG